MARRMGARVAEAAEQVGVAVERTEVDGAFAETVIEHAERLQSDLILLTRFLGRINMDKLICESDALQEILPIIVLPSAELQQMKNLL